MNTAWCALCGAEYLTGTRECEECVVPLVDQRPLTVDEVGRDDEEQTSYEFDDLDNEDRLQVGLLLVDQGVAHAWDGTSLVVRAADEAVLDALVDGLEGAAPVDTTGDDTSDDSGDDTADETGDDTDDETGDDAEHDVAYDLEDWTKEQRAELIDALTAAAIAFDWDEEGELVVDAVDEDRVEAVIDAIDFPDQLPADDGDGDDGLAAAEALSELFLASDRLMHDPDDHEAVLSLHDVARLAEGLDTPYGFNPAIWRDLVAQASSMRKLLEGHTDDDEVREAARSLRNLLRPWV